MLQRFGALVWWALLHSGDRKDTGRRQGGSVPVTNPPTRHIAGVASAGVQTLGLITCFHTPRKASSQGGSAPALPSCCSVRRRRAQAAAAAAAAAVLGDPAALAAVPLSAMGAAGAGARGTEGGASGVSRWREEWRGLRCSAYRGRMQGWACRFSSPPQQS